MADLTQTISNSIGLFGLETTVKWNALTWGIDNWGSNGDVIKLIEKYLSETLSLTDAYPKSVEIGITNTLTNTSSWSVLRSVGDWDYIATRPTTDWIDRAVDLSTIVTDQSSTYTTFPINSTTWTLT